MCAYWYIFSEQANDIILLPFSYINDARQLCLIKVGSRNKTRQRNGKVNVVMEHASVRKKKGTSKLKSDMVGGQINTPPDFDGFLKNMHKSRLVIRNRSGTYPTRICR